MLVVRLHIHDLYKQNISRFGGLYLKRARQIMDPSEVNILHIIGTIIIS
jgi:hypothetical protein